MPTDDLNPNAAMQTPAAPIDRLPGDLNAALELVDTALAKAHAAGVLDRKSVV